MEKMDIVYALGKGSKWSNNEVRYSIRSLVKYCKDWRRIYIIGEWPAFLKADDRLIHIPMPDDKAKTANIWNKMLRATQEEAITDNFLFINDDHFFLKLISAVNYPYYCKGDLADRPFTGNDSYKLILKATYECMLRNQLSTWHFDIHTPIVFNKEKFRQVYQHFHDDIHRGQGIVMKSAYCNFHHIAPVMLQDMKLNRGYSHLELIQKIGDRHIISIADEAITENFVRWMRFRFPEVSPWEK